MDGSVWFQSPIVAQTFLLSALLVAVQHANRWAPLAAGVLLTAAILTRSNLVFALIAVIALLALSPVRLLRSRDRELLVSTVALFAPLVVGFLLNSWYNFARFGSIFESGLAYHNMDPFYRADFERYGYFSLRYMPRNVFWEILGPPQPLLKYPFFNVYPQGTGIVWISPLFLFAIRPLLLAFRKDQQTPVYSRDDAIALVGFFLSLTGIALVVMLAMSMGGTQFGARYTLDFQVFLMLTMLFGLRQPLSKRAQGLALGLLALSLYVQFNGMLIWFRKLAP